MIEDSVGVEFRKYGRFAQLGDYYLLEEIEEMKKEYSLERKVNKK